ncbi:MAG: hypothetical protein HGA31_01090 [Candidatus Moranbacteria bacterium]|nr:hypothetical protein [Candidatus Moranbacteria bacterium]
MDLHKPTVLGQPRDTGTVLQPAPQGTGELQLASASSPMFLSLEPARRDAVMLRVEKADFLSLQRLEVSLIGKNAEDRLNEVIDGFMSQVTEESDPKLFKLISKLSDSVAAEKLDEVANKIMTDEPSLFDKAKAIFFSAQKREEAARKAWEEIRRVLQAKALNLVNVIRPMEQEVQVSQGVLLNEVQDMELRIKAYRDSFPVFVDEVIFAKLLLEKGTAQVAAFRSSADPNNITQKMEIDELEAKLQSLTSRALSLEGTMTKLPADNIVLSQIQNAGIQQFEETANSIVGKFVNIKKNLLKLHSAITIRENQMIAEKSDALDKNIAAISGSMGREVITKAANAPGDNRLAQAQEILDIVKETKELEAINKQAIESNKAKFDQTRQMFEQAQREMLALKS